MKLVYQYGSMLSCSCFKIFSETNSPPYTHTSTSRTTTFHFLQRRITRNCRTLNTSPMSLPCMDKSYSNWCMQVVHNFAAQLVWPPHTVPCISNSFQHHLYSIEHIREIETLHSCMNIPKLKVILSLRLKHSPYKKHSHLKDTCTTIVQSKNAVCAFQIDLQATSFSFREILHQWVGHQFSFISKDSIYYINMCKYSFLSWEWIKVNLYV